MIIKITKQEIEKQGREVALYDLEWMRKSIMRLQDEMALLLAKHKVELQKRIDPKNGHTTLFLGKRKK